MSGMPDSLSQQEQESPLFRKLTADPNYNGSMVWLLLLLLLPAHGFAQAKPGPKRWPIERLTVEGLKNYSPQQTLAAAGLKTGQLAGQQDFEAARDRLLATGVFETVGYKFAP